MASKTQQAQAALTGTLPDVAPPNLITGVTPGTEPANVNFGNLVKVDDVMEGDQLEADNTPQIQSLTLIRQAHGTTTIAARVFDPKKGWVNRHHAISGLATAQRIADAIADIANWS